MEMKRVHRSKSSHGQYALPLPLAPSSDPVRELLAILGLSREETLLYRTLVAKGTQTALELARGSNISRTQVYRFLENLTAKGLVEEVVDEHRTMAKAADLSQLERLVQTKKQTAEKLDILFPAARTQLTATMGQMHDETRVQFYRGKAGVRQMVWNTLRAEREVVGYTYRRLEEFIGRPYMDDWAQAFVRKGLVLRDIYSDEYVKSKETAPGHVLLESRHFLSVYLPSSILDIQLQMDIYNDVVAQYSWHQGEVFGVELCNKTAADFHRNIFEILWKMGKKEHGSFLSG